MDNPPRVPPPEITAKTNALVAAMLDAAKVTVEGGPVSEILRHVRTVAEARAELDRAIAALAEERDRLTHIKDIVGAQALDDGLWCRPLTATEAYLQRELRILHATIEGDAPIIALIAATREMESRARSTPSEARHEPQQPHEG